MTIRKDEILFIWESMDTKSWDSLTEVINDYLNRPEWENNLNFGMIRDFAEKMIGEPFPQSADDLYQMLNDQLGR